MLAEAVKVTFDPRQVSYGKILQIYFSVAHDPTQLNRQGPDSGPQYRSEIFPQNEAQQKVAKDYIAQLDKETDNTASSPTARRIARALGGTRPPTLRRSRVPD